MKRIIIIVLFIINLTIAAVIANGDQVNLAWYPNGLSPSGYRIFMRMAGGHYDYTHWVWPKDSKYHIETECTITDLKPGTTYYFVARSYVGDDQSADSNEVTYTAKGSVPDTVKNVKTTKEDGSMFLISDPQPAGELDYFEVEIDGSVVRSDAQRDGDQVRLHHDLTGITMGKHTVRISAVNGWGKGEWSDPLAFDAALPSKASGIGLSVD